MGWDIHVICEVKLNDQWSVAEDVTIFRSIDGNETISVYEPIAEFRNYNLFRPLANIHNTVEDLARENNGFKASFPSFSKNLNHQTSERVRSLLQPETTAVTDVINYHRYLPNDASDIVKHFFEYIDDDEIYWVTLNELGEFVSEHEDYSELNDFYIRAQEKYYACKLIADKQGYNITRDDFRIIYGFDY